MNRAIHLWTRPVSGLSSSTVSLPSGSRIWRRWGGYRRRSRVGSKMNCIKLLGQLLMARDFERQVAELQVRIAVLNVYTALMHFFSHPQQSSSRNIR